jgi:hypothetical protein
MYNPDPGPLRNNENTGFHEENGSRQRSMTRLTILLFKSRWPVAAANRYS